MHEHDRDDSKSALPGSANGSNRPKAEAADLRANGRFEPKSRQWAQDDARQHGMVQKCSSRSSLLHSMAAMRTLACKENPAP
jgi:hypothetical protein